MVLVGVSALGIGLREIHWTIIFIKPGVNGGNKWTLLPRLFAVREVASDIQECLDYYTVQKKMALQVTKFMKLSNCQERLLRISYHMLSLGRQTFRNRLITTFWRITQEKVCNT